MLLGPSRWPKFPKQRYAWANEGHVPDIIHKHAAANGNHVLYESKVYSSLIKSANNQGGGTSSGGGYPSTVAAGGRPCRVRLLRGEAHG